jgi:hypothetical protein
MSKWSDFIGTERDRHADEDNNKFAMCFSQVSRYLEFVAVILKRYEDVSHQFLKNTKDMQASMSPGTHPMTGKQMALHEDGLRLNVLLHLEIESYYLFAKIFLDKIAHALEFYFGQGRKMPLDSHDNLVKYFAAYAEQKRLKLPPNLMDLAAKLKKDISDYRDYEIAHEKSPRRMSGTVFDEHGTMRISAISLYPTEKDQQIESKSLHELSADIDKYINGVIAVIRSNCSKTRLKAAAPTTAPTQ